MMIETKEWEAFKKVSKISFGEFVRRALKAYLSRSKAQKKRRGE